MKYRKKPEIVKVVQWFKLGDHPEVIKLSATFPFQKCVYCKKLMELHGWLKSCDSMVCPENWIVKNKEDIFRVYNTNIFKSLYEPIEENNTTSSSITE